MKGDFSRSTHRATNRYSSVRLQQGRVLLDAEWNEQADLALHRERATVVDVVGRTGAPKHLPTEFRHFKVALSEDARDLRLAPGHVYVEGLLCENHDVAGTPLSAQPDLPGLTLPVSDGAYVVYLDVWERHLTTVDQTAGDFPSLREVALGGPDTATRVQVVWQAKLAPTERRGCGGFVPPPAPTGRLRARAVPAEEAENDCLVPQGGGYRRLENQLYRVEVHDAIAAGPRIKWSRDNGSIVSKVLAVDQAARTIRVEDPGRDDVLGFAGARFVELIDEARVLRNEPGILLEVQTVLGDEVTVLNPANVALAMGSHPTLRRWDGVVSASAATPIELEDGVQVELDRGAFASGDYWLVAARTLTGKVEWPTDGVDPPVARFEPRHGTHHHFCALASVQVAGGVFSDVSDCRPMFPPLTAIAAADVSYDASACDNLTKARTVQQAIDILCRASADREPGIRIEKVSLMSGRPLENDAVVHPEEFSKGITITCDKPVFQDSVRNPRGLPNPVCSVTIDLPWPTTSTEAEQWQMASLGSIGFTTITVAADVNADDASIVWVPLGAGTVIVDVRAWLAGNLFNALAQRTHGQQKRVLTRLSLKGNFIWGPRSPDLYLDGEVFGVPARDRTAIRLPSGNDRRGGNFDMWFWLGTDVAPVRPERIGLIPGRTSRFFSSTVGRDAVNRGIQRDLRTLNDVLPQDYGVDAMQPFDPRAAADLAARTGVPGLTGFTSARVEKVGAIVADMLTTNLRIPVRAGVVADNTLVAQVRRAMAAGNPPDFIVGDETLMAALTDLQYAAQASMIVI